MDRWPIAGTKTLGGNSPSQRGMQLYKTAVTEGEI